jgi:hypothetical protein
MIESMKEPHLKYDGKNFTGENMKELSRKELNKHLEKYILEHTELRPHFKAKLGKCPIHKGDGETLKVYPESFECVVCGAKGDIFGQAMYPNTENNTLDGLRKWVEK